MAGRAIIVPRRAVVVHGGAGSPPDLADGCRTAAQAGFELLRQGKTALEAAIAAVVVLEDDGRYNAGSGSVLRLDGRTVEMDASVMDSTGTLGAVACITGVRNPVLVARQVAGTPHVLLCGAGATMFARRCGFPEHTYVSPRSLERHRRLVDLLKSKHAGRLPAAWQDFDLEQYWNFDIPYREVVEPGDTVGAVALDGEGRFAVASSTGGSTPMLRGRIGDTPLPGCGFFAGNAGAVAATGIGEEIIRRTLARRVYDLIAAGRTPEAACQEGVALFPPEIAVGLIAIGEAGPAVVANMPMAAHTIRD